MFSLGSFVAFILLNEIRNAVRLLRVLIYTNKGKHNNNVVADNVNNNVIVDVMCQHRGTRTVTNEFDFSHLRIYLFRLQMLLITILSRPVTMSYITAFRHKTGANLRNRSCTKRSNICDRVTKSNTKYLSVACAQGAVLISIHNTNSYSYCYR